MAPTATKEGGMTEEEAKIAKGKEQVAKSEKRKKIDSAKEKEPAAKAAKQEPVNIYQTILALERAESVERSPDSDHVIWKDTCGELRSLMKEIFDMKMKKGDGGDISERRIQASLLFVTLKKLNRLEKLRIKGSRDATNASKQGVDSFNLQLQNLLYEVLHLKKEVTKCVHFKSADESLTLIPEEQFFQEAPEEIAKPDVTKTDPHALQLARLEWELAKRRELGEEAERREGERDGLELGIRQREERLRELQPQLQAVLAASRPVQDYLALPLDRRREQARLARLLPAPLYICYSQVAAYCEAGDPLVEAAVLGDPEEARKWMDDQKAEQAEDEAEEDVREQDSQDEDDENKKKRGKSSAKADVKKEAVLAFHPLSVSLEVKAQEVAESSLVVTLHFIPALGIVTVQSSLGGEAKLSGEAVDPATILSHLFPGDCGLTPPGPATEHRLVEAGLQADSVAQLLPTHRAYTWAQKLCGLDFLSEEPPAAASASASASTSREVVRAVVQALRTRLVARLDLARQLAKLATCKASDHLLPFSLAGTYPARVVSRLKAWAAADWESYSMAACTAHLTRHKVVDENDFLFKATCMREKATLVAYVAIKPSYPAEAPIFALSLSNPLQSAAPRPPGSPRLKGETIDTSEWVRDFERELNLNWSDQLVLAGPGRAGLLTAQLHRLLVLMDVVLEAATEAEKGFAKSQVFFSSLRGRVRRLPLQYCSKSQVFQQR